MRYFTVGLALGLAVVLWAIAKMAAIFTVVSAILLLATPALPRTARFLVAGLFAGALIAHLSLERQLDKQFTSNQAQRDFHVAGTVVGVPKHDSRRTRFLFRIDKYLDNPSQSTPERIQLSWYGSAQAGVTAGDRWELMVRLKPPSSLGNPGGFHYTRWLFQKRVHATGYVRDSPSPKRVGSDRLNLHRFRQTLATNLEQLPAANEYVALVQGLTVGVTSKISREHWQSLRLSGTAHLLAISGLHIGLVSGWCFFFAGFVWTGIRFVYPGNTRFTLTRPVFALGFGVLGACVYAALAGFSLPTQRALIMLTVFSSLTFLRCIWPPGSALLLALLIVLLIDPLAVLSIGFWLSFGTVAALFYLHQGRIGRSGKMQSAVSVHLKLGVVLLPATAWFFQQGAMFSPLANAVAVPIVGILVVPGSFLIALLTPVWPWAANGLLVAVQWILAQLITFLDWLLLLPGASLPLFLPGAFVLMCSLLALVLLFSPRGLHLRWLCVPLIVPALTLNMVGKQVQVLELHVLDVGQGLAAVMFTPNHTVLFDTGRKAGGDATMVDRVIQPFLIANGREHISISVLSHADDDHAGGIDALVELYPQTQLISSDSEHHEQYHAQPCVAGQSFVLDNVTFGFLHPGHEDTFDRNNQSCVLLVHTGKARILLTGDIESEAEARLVRRVGAPLPINVLIAPHHGSRSSSTDQFVSMFRPDTVIYPSGEANRFGFPHEDVLARYQEIGALGYITGTGGAVSIQFDSSGVVKPAVQYWDSHRRYRR